MNGKLVLSFSIALMLLVSGRAQLTPINESCDQMPCESGLYCIELKDGQKKCSSCDQSKQSDLTAEVDRYCHACEENGFSENSYTENGPIYQEAISSDGRVMVDVYDQVLEIGKKCRDARVYRENQCWNGGNSGHKQAITQVENCMAKVVEKKKTAIDNKMVYYCSKSTYESKLSTFNSKCSLSQLDNAKAGIEKLSDDYNRITGSTTEDKINCSTIENYVYDCQRCSEAANALLYDAFQNNVDKMPKTYFETWDRSESIIKLGQELLKNVKDKSLCN
jgi:hypothetical protein